MADPIKRPLISKALKKMLGLNYRCLLLDLVISATSVEWHYAVSELRDSEYKWQPKVIIFNDRDQEIGIWNGLADRNPTMVKAATILAMAEQHIQKPM